MICALLAHQGFNSPSKSGTPPYKTVPKRSSSAYFILYHIFFVLSTSFFCWTFSFCRQKFELWNHVIEIVFRLCYTMPKKLERLCFYDTIWNICSDLRLYRRRYLYFFFSDTQCSNLVLYTIDQYNFFHASFYSSRSIYGCFTECSCSRSLRPSYFQR